MRLRDAPFPLPPLFYPTRVMHVDDHSEYGGQLPLILTSDVELVAYTSARLAQKAFHASLDREAACHEERFQSGIHGVDLIHHIVYDASRFADFSVVLADFLMPEMNGFDFLKGLSTTSVGRVLLSGNVAADVALRAFNEGAIERFLSKSDRKIAEQLNHTVNQLRWRYFVRKYRSFADSVTVSEFSFLRDPVFVDALKQRLIPIDAVEMYIHAHPRGLLFLDANGRAAFLLVNHTQDTLALGQLADQADLPAETRNRIRAGTLIPVAADPRQDVVEQGFTAATQFVEATMIRGVLADYSTALLSDLRCFDLDRVKSYDDWLWSQPASVMH